MKHRNKFYFHSREDNCIKETSWSAAFPIFIFMLAQLLLGCSGSPIFTLGTTYIDDHVKRDTASVYLGVIYSMVAFGPVLGKYRLLLLLLRYLKRI
jgi:organic anion transporter 3A